MLNKGDTSIDRVRSIVDKRLGSSAWSGEESVSVSSSSVYMALFDIMVVSSIRISIREAIYAASQR